MLTLFVASLPALLPPTPTAPQSSADPAPSFAVVNLQRNAIHFQIGQRAVAFAVPEAQSGESDWNGDGDRLDAVLFHADLETGAITNTGLGLATSPIVQIDVHGPWFAFKVAEISQGSDLNGDGDENDFVLHFLDSRSGVVTNTGVSGHTLAFDGAIASFHVGEAEQGMTDLNGDGDALDFVLHSIQLATMTTRNHRLALFVTPAPVANGHIAAAVRESMQGADLNGDGDQLDYVMHLVAPSGTIANLGRAVASDGADYFRRNTLLYSVDERGEAADWNADGDQNDYVLHEYDVSAETEINHAIAVDGLGYGTNGSHSFALVSERNQASTDLNGDGDTLDSVLHVGLIGGSFNNVGLASIPPTFAGTRFVFRVSEVSQGADLNGDGDMIDYVPHIRDGVNGATTNLALAMALNGATEYVAFEDFMAFYVKESSQGADLNGDNDTFDDVLHTHRYSTGATENLRMATSLATLHRGRRFLAFDRGELNDGGVDWNGDGDILDTVTHVLDLAADGVGNLALPIFSSGSTPAQLLRGKYLAMRVREVQQGNTDLNGDGDMDDEILHLVRIVPARLRTGSAGPDRPVR